MSDKEKKEHDKNEEIKENNYDAFDKEMEDMSEAEKLAQELDADDMTDELDDTEFPEDVHRTEHYQRKKKSGLQKIQTGNNMSIGMCFGMVIGFAYGILSGVENWPVFMVLGMSAGICVGTFWKRTISNASIEYLEELKQESEVTENYLMETIHIDYSNQAIQDKTMEVIAPVEEAVRKQYALYLGGIALFREQYAKMVDMSDKELAKLRQNWEKDHQDIMRGKTKKECEKYWAQVEKGFHMWQLESSKAIFVYVRDEIPHSFDIHADVVTARASDVLKEKTGICHAKANLLAAMLRSVGIPCGICFEYLHFSRKENAYCLHAFNAIYIDMEWIYVDARGNKEGVNAQFSEDEPELAFLPDEDKKEYFVGGIFVAPHEETMRCLEESSTIDEVAQNLPDNDASLLDRLQGENNF